jgi:hypothetical protein
MIVMMIASTASLKASSRLVVMRVSLESDECRSTDCLDSDIGERQRGRSSGRVRRSGRLAGPRGRRLRRAASGGSKWCRGLALCRGGAWPVDQHRTVGMPTFGYARSALTRLRQRLEDRQPRTTRQPGCCPAETAGGSPGGWKRRRRLRCRGSHPSDGAQSRSLKLVAERT